MLLSDAELFDRADNAAKLAVGVELAPRGVSTVTVCFACFSALRSSCCADCVRTVP